MFRRAALGLSRIVVTPRTAKHRFFKFERSRLQFESEVVGIAIEGAEGLGVLSSAIHLAWVDANAASFGAFIGNIRYNQTRCFDPFPFPVIKDEALRVRICTLAEHLDAHRKRQQAAHADLTLTGIYNVLEKLKSGEALNAKDKLIHEHGLVSVLKQLHDELDLAVLDAYGWADLAPLMQCVNGNAPHPNGASRDDAIRELDEALLERLVALNAERAAEEARGLIRWLRPDFQNPSAHSAPDQSEIDTGDDDSEPSVATVATATTRTPWPKDLTDQVRAIADTLASAPAPLTESELADRFTGRGRWRERLPRILDMLVALGNVKQADGRYRRV